jgi:hypothetical protein
VQVLGLGETLRVLESSNAFTDVMALPERQKEWRFKPTPGAKTQLDIALTPAITAWLHGLDMPSLAATTLPDVPSASWRLEQMVDAVSGTFEHYLSWTIGAVIEQANDMLSRDGGLVLCADHLTYAIRYGVDTEIALTLLMRGVRSRRIAHLVGRRATDLGLDLDAATRWLTELHIDGWVRDFGATDREIEDLSEVVRDSGASLMRQVLGGEGVVLLREPVAIPLSPGTPVRLAVAGANEPVVAWSLGTNPYLIGQVSAQHHADVVLLHQSGLIFDVTTDGTTLTMRANPA